MQNPDTSNNSHQIPLQNSEFLFNSPPVTRNYTDLEVVRRLNKSKFPVFLARSKSENKNYAMKIYPFKDQKISEFFIKERQFNWLSHPNLISILDTQETKKGYGNKKPIFVSYILMEYAPYGDFSTLNSKRMLPRNDKLVRTYFHQLITGVQYLHENSIAHMDLKLDNLLLGKDFVLRISDFDFSMDIKQDFVAQTQGVANYRAPELKAKKCKNFKAADIYSAGIILFLLKTGFLPYAEDGNSIGECLYRDLLEGKEEEFWRLHESREGMPSFEESFKSLFIWMTNPDPKKRPTVGEVMNCEWMRGPLHSQVELACIMHQKVEGYSYANIPSASIF